MVHAWVWPMFTKKLGPVRGVEGSGLRHSAEAILAEGVDLARTALAAARAAGPGPRSAAESQAEPGHDVEGVMETGLPAPVLRDAAQDARLLVVSSRGLGGVLGHVAGSVCLDLAGSSPMSFDGHPPRAQPRPGRGAPSSSASTGRPGAPRRWPAPPGWRGSSGQRCRSSTSTRPAAGPAKGTAGMPGTARNCWTTPLRRPGTLPRTCRSPASCGKATRPPRNCSRPPLTPKSW